MRVHNLIQLFRNLFPDTERFGKIERILRIVLVIFVIAIFVAQIRQIYTIPINKPYFDGAWDEPFSVNAGINAIKTGGDPLFYVYGGTSVYPYSLVYYHYCNNHKILPKYQVMTDAQTNPHYPITRKIQPIKPIYVVKVIAVLFYLAGSAVFTILFVWLLFPVASLIIPSIESSSLFSQYADLMLPQTHLGLMSGVTAIVFIKAIMETDIKRYFCWVLFCAVGASITVAIKINAIYILFLPAALCWRLYSEKHLNIRRIFMLTGAAIVPFILVNPAIIFNPSNYFQYLRGIADSSGYLEPAALMSRTAEISQLLKNLYLVNFLPAALLLLLLVVSIVMTVRKNPVAFAGFIFFLLFSFYSITTMNHKFFVMYSRHYVFLLLPFLLFSLFPLIYLFSKAGNGLRALVTFICLMLTIFSWSPFKLFSDIASLPSRKFASDWPRESRDQLAEFVNAQNAVVYFYDFHGFSLPETIQPQLIPFISPGELPAQLKADEYIAFIKYKSAAKLNENADGQYNEVIHFLQNTYQTVHVFGPPDGAHDLHKQSPQSNPCIVILKEKKPEQ